MTTISASSISGALARAKGTGQVEEAVCIDGTDLVFRSLTAQENLELTASMAEVPDGPEYMAHFQLENVSRSLVEVNGVDLRECLFISISPDKKVEKHQYLKDELLSTWSKEAVYVACRKVLDLAEMADAKAQEGVSFKLEAETHEDELHRLLSKARDVGADVPDDIKEAILREYGFAPAVSEEELAQLREQETAWFKQEQEKAQQASFEDELEAQQTSVSLEFIGDPRLEQTPRPQEQAPVEVRPARAPQQVVQALDLTQRKPLNTEPVQVVPGSKAAQIATELAELNTLGLAESKTASVGVVEHAPVVLERSVRQAPVEPVVLDEPPAGGINPRFDRLRRQGMIPRRDDRA